MRSRTRLTMIYLRHAAVSRCLVSIALISIALALAHISYPAAANSPEQALLRPRLRSTPKPTTRFGSSPSSTSTTTTSTPTSQSTKFPKFEPLAASTSTAANAQLSSGANRTARTADVFQNGDGFNIFVTNTCELESMKVNVKTSKPFFGVIHTKNQRQKQGCSVEGNGDTEYNLDINHILNEKDSAYCGVIKPRRDSQDDKDVLSVVVAVRVHKNIELSDDKFFLLNCTNRCRKPDCSTPANAKLFDIDDNKPNGRLESGDGEREGINTTSRDGLQTGADECTIWKFPWVITLLWCMGILLLAMIISHCIMCSSLVCRCVKTEVEDTEPSVYEGATDYDDDDFDRRNVYKIEYDNKDIYKTSNNYHPYRLDENQAKKNSPRPQT